MENYTVKAGYINVITLIILFNIMPRNVEMRWGIVAITPFIK